MVDSITIERRGLPVMAFAVDSLAKTVGRAMMRAHGFPNFPLVEIPAPFFESVAPTDEEFEAKIVPAVDRALKVLSRGDPNKVDTAAPEAEAPPTGGR